MKSIQMLGLVLVAAVATGCNAEKELKEKLGVQVFYEAEKGKDDECAQKQLDRFVDDYKKLPKAAQQELVERVKASGLNVIRVRATHVAQVRSGERATLHQIRVLCDYYGRCWEESIRYKRVVDESKVEGEMRETEYSLEGTQLILTPQKGEDRIVHSIYKTPYYYTYQDVVDAATLENELRYGYVRLHARDSGVGVTCHPTVGLETIFAEVE